MGVACDSSPWTNFRSLIPWRLHMKFGFDWPSSFWEDVWRVWTTDGRNDGDCLYYKLTHEPKGSGELKSNQLLIFKHTVMTHTCFNRCWSRLSLSSAGKLSTLRVGASLMLGFISNGIKNWLLPSFTCSVYYHFDRHNWANSVDPDQTAPKSGSILFAIPSVFFGCIILC